MSVDQQTLLQEARERDEQYARELTHLQEALVEAATVTPAVIKAAATRVYEVKDKGTDKLRYVEANNAAQAMRHVVKDTFSVRVPNTLEVARAMGDGAKLEHANEAAADPA